MKNASAAVRCIFQKVAVFDQVLLVEQNSSHGKEGDSVHGKVSGQKVPR